MKMMDLNVLLLLQLVPLEAPALQITITVCYFTLIWTFFSFGNT